MVCWPAIDRRWLLLVVGRWWFGVRRWLWLVFVASFVGCCVLFDVCCFCCSWFVVGVLVVGCWRLVVGCFLLALSYC